jgi:hypothetical protein
MIQLGKIHVFWPLQVGKTTSEFSLPAADGPRRVVRACLRPSFRASTSTRSELTLTSYGVSGSASPLHSRVAYCFAASDLRQLPQHDDPVLTSSPTDTNTDGKQQDVLVHERTNCKPYYSIMRA